MSQKRILIVDDEESILTVLKGSLKKLGPDYQVVTVTDGFAALDQLLDQPFDLVVTDYNMAQMDGLELMEAIRYAQPDARIIMITAYGYEALENEVERLKAYRYLTKPLDINDFRQIVGEALQDRTAGPPGVLVLSDEQYRQITRLLEQLRTDVSARCVLLTNAEGRTMARIGDVEQLPMEQITSLLGGGIATLIEAGRTLDGDAEAVNLAYREGKNEYLYALNVGQQMLLFLVIDRGPYSSRLGSAWYYAQQTALTLREKLNRTKQASPQQIFNQAVDKAFDAELDKLFNSDDCFGT
jgi:two-component system response regulator (stage 0 sporulation protein F)